eukprot:scaffold99440_cov63-Phaeocystis_antarctica.AAC.3
MGAHRPISCCELTADWASGHVESSRPEASANSPSQHAPPAPDQAQGGLTPRPASANRQIDPG